MSIFEKIGEKLSGAGQGVAQQVKNFADVARLNSIISEKEKQIAQLYIEIGQAYYEHHKIDPQGEEIERIQKISSLNAEILECKENIKQIKGVTKCPNCGADVSLDAAFCNACGTKIPPGQRLRIYPLTSRELCVRSAIIPSLLATHSATIAERKSNNDNE